MMKQNFYAPKIMPHQSDVLSKITIKEKKKTPKNIYIYININIYIVKDITMRKHDAGSIVRSKEKVVIFLCRMVKWAGNVYEWKILSNLPGSRYRGIDEQEEEFR